MTGRSLGRDPHQGPRLHGLHRTGRGRFLATRQQSAALPAAEGKKKEAVSQRMVFARTRWPTGAGACGLCRTPPILFSFGYGLELASTIRCLMPAVVGRHGLGRKDNVALSRSLLTVTALGREALASEKGGTHAPHLSAAVKAAPCQSEDREEDLKPLGLPWYARPGATQSAVLGRVDSKRRLEGPGHLADIECPLAHLRRMFSGGASGGCGPRRESGDFTPSLHK